MHCDERMRNVRQQGEIIKVEGEHVWIKFADPSEACGNCRGCLRLSGKQREAQVLKLQYDRKVDIGDRMMIEYPSERIFQSMLVLYGLPVIGLFIGYFLTLYFTSNDSISALVALVSLVLFIVVARLIAGKLDAKAPEPQIVAKICQS